MKPSRFSINRLPAHTIKTMSHIALALVFALVGFGAFYVALVVPSSEACLIAIGLSAISLTCAAGLAAERE